MYSQLRPQFATQGAELEGESCKNQGSRFNMNQMTYQQDQNEYAFDDGKEMNFEYCSNYIRSRKSSNEYQPIGDSPVHKDILANGLYEIDQDKDSCNVRNISHDE